MTDLWRPRFFTLELQIGAAGAWVDVTADIDESPLVWTWGVTDRFGPTQPSTFTVRLQDMDPSSAGKYNPDNPASPYYGLLKEGVAARWTVNSYVPPLDNSIIERRVFGTVAKLGALWLDDDSSHARTLITVTDVLADWGRKTLRDILTEQTMHDGAIAFWKLDDPDGALAAAESSPSTQSPLEITGDPLQVQWGAGKGTPNDDAASVGFNSDPDGTASGLTGSVVWPAGASTDNYVVECWISLDPDKVPTVSGELAVVLDISDTATGSPTFRVVVNNLGHIFLTSTPGTVRAVADGHLHHIAVERYSGPTYALYVDGTMCGSIGASAHPVRGLTIGCESPYTNPANWHTTPGITYVGWRGTIGRLAVYKNESGPTYPTRTAVLAHYALSTQMIESAPARIVRLLSYLGTPPNALGPSATGSYPLLASSTELSGAQVGPQATAGMSLLAAIQEAWAGEGGRIWTWLLKGASYGSGVVFGGRGGLDPSTPVITLDVEADLDGPPEMVRDRDGQVSSVVAQSRSLAVTVRDDTLAGDIGELTTTISCALADEAELLWLAQRRLDQTSTVRQRLTALRVNVATATLTPNPAPTAFPSPPSWSLMGLLLRLVPGARVRVTGFSSARQGYTSRDAYVIGATETHSAEGHVWDLVLEDAD